jgi:Nif-specific regulatory protein
MADAVDQTDSQNTVRLALDTIRNLTRADVVGFLGLHEEGNVLPRLILPDSSEMDLSLSRRLTAEIGQRRQSLWLGKDRESSLSPTASLAPFRDVIGVPLLAQDNLLGVLHAYRHENAFGEADFQFCEIVSHFLSAQLRLSRMRQQLQEENRRLRHRVGSEDRLLGDSAIMAKLRSTLERVAPLPSTVLIQGESGVGKELVAQALHYRSRRNEGPFVVMNCAAIPSTLLESQLFGHKKGAFTDARTDQEGYFSRADGGTLFLDEVGELPPECQAKLLRVLEGHSFTPLGDNVERWVDVRFLAATNRDLEKEVREGRFRSDLYYRLHVVVISVPLLRDHLEDVPLLAAHFLDRCGAEYGRKYQLTPTAVQRLQSYSWPGNVRQLRHVLESAAAQADSNVLDAPDLHLAGKEFATALPTLKLEELERLAIAEALRSTNNQITEAANILGIARSTFYQKAKNAGLIS